MKFLRIGSNKLKASLTAADCERFGIRCDTDPDSFDKKEVKTAVFTILEEAKKQCGFDIGEEKILIQLYPIENGTCELFVTKLGTLSPKERDDLVRSRKITYAETVTEIFRFANIGQLLLCARTLSDKTVKSDLFIDNCGVYYLRVSENTVDGISSILPIFEFGERVPELPYDIEGERGRLIYRDTAIESLNKE